MNWSSLCSWCAEHWELLATLFVNLVLLIIMIAKKKVKVVDVLTTVFTALPGFIRDAELHGGTGEEKFVYAMNLAIDLVTSLTGQNRSECIRSYGVQIEHQLESILATPQKKEK